MDDCTLSPGSYGTDALTLTITKVADEPVRFFADSFLPFADCGDPPFTVYVICVAPGPFPSVRSRSTFTLASHTPGASGSASEDPVKPAT